MAICIKTFGIMGIDIRRIDIMGINTWRISTTGIDSTSINQHKLCKTKHAIIVFETFSLLATSILISFSISPLASQIHAPQLFSLNINFCWHFSLVLKELNQICMEAELSGSCSLLVTFCSVLVTFCLLIVTFCLLLFYL